MKIVQVYKIKKKYPQLHESFRVGDLLIKRKYLAPFSSDTYWRYSNLTNLECHRKLSVEDVEKFPDFFEPKVVELKVIK